MIAWHDRTLKSAAHCVTAPEWSAIPETGFGESLAMYSKRT
jgi:hypothetical protein